jgi:hypothetical protein
MNELIRRAVAAHYRSSDVLVYPGASRITQVETARYVVLSGFDGQPVAVYRIDRAPDDKVQLRLLKNPPESLLVTT